MFEEPYRWIEAVENRRAYLDEQFKQGSPVVALVYDSGILLLTFSSGTQKIYEIYDRIALGGMGHPADLERLRSSLLEMAHLEGFNRSPSDVTIARLMKFGLAPPVKQAFEEIFRAPSVIKLLLVQLAPSNNQSPIMSLNYDGVFEEFTDRAALAATPEIGQRMTDYLQQTKSLSSLPRDSAIQVALKAWAVGFSSQKILNEEKGQEEKKGEDPFPSLSEMDATITEAIQTHKPEIAILEEGQTGSSKFRPLSPKEMEPALSQWVHNPKE